MRKKREFKDWIPGRIYKCKICGKSFYVEHPNLWVYKLGMSRGHVYRFCSYTCFRIAEKTDCKPPQHQVHTAKPDYKPPERYYEIRKLRDAGMSHKEIAKKYGLHETSIGSIIARLNKFERDGGKERPYNYDNR